MEHKISKKIMKKKDKVGGLMCPNFKNILQNYSNQDSVVLA